MGRRGGYRGKGQGKIYREVVGRSVQMWLRWEDRRYKKVENGAYTEGEIGEKTVYTLYILYIHSVCVYITHTHTHTMFIHILHVPVMYVLYKYMYMYMRKKMKEIWVKCRSRKNIQRGS